MAGVVSPEMSPSCSFRGSGVRATRRRSQMRTAVIVRAETAVKKRSVAILGAGPTGLSCAIMLAQRGYENISVFERLSEPLGLDDSEWSDPQRSYQLGLSARGQLSLGKLGALETVLSHSAPVRGRLDFSPSTRREIPSDPQSKSEQGKLTLTKERDPGHDRTETQVLPRDRLVACLLEEVRTKYPSQIQVTFGCEFVNASWMEGGCVDVEIANGDGNKIIKPKCDLLVGADGVNSKLLRLLSEKSQSKIGIVQPKEMNTRVYKKLPLYLPKSHRNDLNISCRGDDGVVVEGLPLRDTNIVVGLVLLRPENNPISKLGSVEEAESYFREKFPWIADWIRREDLQKLIESDISPLPKFQYARGALHYGDTSPNTVLLGDCIHTVKPYFGMGVNSAFEDVTIMSEMMEAHDDDLSRALPAFTQARVEDTKVLVTLSHGFDKGFFHFVLPIIVDTMFNKIAPKIFMPTTIRLLQNEKYTFRAVLRRKRLDRGMQCAVICGVLTAVFAVLRRLVSAFIAALPL